MIRSVAFILSLLLSPYSTLCQITLSEIMFDPVNSEYYYEFIEIYNLSANDSIDLSGWKISDGNDYDQIIAVDEGLIIAPEQFGIILDNGYFNHERVYDNLIPPEALVLTIDGSTFGSGGLSNSTPEKISLLNANNDTISVYRYSLDNPEGYSDEKINLAGSNSQDNWANSKTIQGTPGFENSVSPLDFDVAIKLSFEPLIPSANSNITISGTIINSGIVPATDLDITFYVDRNADSIATSDEKIGSSLHISETIVPRDSLIATIIWHQVTSGIHTIIARVDFSYDQNITNNVAIKTLAVSFKRLDLVINEIMFHPFPMMAEWIELYNPSDSSIDLSNWKVSDSNTDFKNFIVTNSLSIKPHNFLIITENANIIEQYPDIDVPIIELTNWSTLNNDFDAVVLYDLTNTTIDSMVYFSEWGKTKGVSLERIDYLWTSTDSSTWAPCIAPRGATPGTENSVAVADFDLALQELHFSSNKPNPGESIIVIANVVNVGRNPIGYFSVTFFNDANKDSILDEDEQISDIITHSDTLRRYDQVKISTIWNNVPSGLQDIYAIISSPSDMSSANNKIMAQLNVSFNKYSLVINEIMYSPFYGQPEWIELYNRTKGSINFQGWGLSDIDTSSIVIISSTPFYIEPDSFLVISSAPLNKELFPEPLSATLVSSNLPNLNNNFDSIYLYDLNLNIIDLVQYKNSWGGETGISLERINPDLPSADSSNWSSCVYPQGGTPGKKNSIFIQTLPSSTGIIISPNPFSPDSDGFDDVTIINYQLPVTTATINIKIYDVRGRLVKFLCNNLASGAKGSVIWDGKNDDDNLCRIGIYIVYLEALNAVKGLIVSHKKTVVLAAKL